jgi:Uma2 family endonuclease
MSFEQYLLLVNNSDQRYEYHDGEVRLLAGGTSNHAAIALNFGAALDSALSEDSLCRPYVADKLVRVTPTKVVVPDVVVSCDRNDHGTSQIIQSPILVVEVLSRSTEMADRFEKLTLYQAKGSIQEILLISQYVQRVEVFFRSATSWLYQQYGAGQSFHITSLNVTIETRRLYRRLSIPVLIEEAEEHTADSEE